mmetsp:Transcript_42020/g.116008  ORF Transcript_42020/g.116008 Transcript_42020/m.116008 type:complete len:324 (-) Transcript_42020:23-994(-)
MAEEARTHAAQVDERVKQAALQFRCAHYAVLPEEAHERREGLPPPRQRDHASMQRSIEKPGLPDHWHQAGGLRQRDVEIRQFARCWLVRTGYLLVGLYRERVEGMIPERRVLVVPATVKEPEAQGGRRRRGGKADGQRVIEVRRPLGNAARRVCTQPVDSEKVLACPGPTIVVVISGHVCPRTPGSRDGREHLKQGAAPARGIGLPSDGAERPGVDDVASENHQMRPHARQYRSDDRDVALNAVAASRHDRHHAALFRPDIKLGTTRREVVQVCQLQDSDCIGRVCLLGRVVAPQPPVPKVLHGPRTNSASGHMPFRTIGSKA